MSCGPCRKAKLQKLGAALAIVAATIGGAWFVGSDCAEANTSRGCGPCFPSWVMPGTTWSITDGTNTLLQITDSGATGTIIFPNSGGGITNNAGNGTSSVSLTTTVMDLTMPNGGSIRFRDPSLNSLGSVFDQGTTGQLRFDFYSSQTNNGSITFEDQTGNDLAVLVDNGTNGRFDVGNFQIGNTSGTRIAYTGDSGNNWIEPDGTGWIHEFPNGGSVRFLDGSEQTMATLTDLGTEARWSVRDTQTDSIQSRSGATVTIEDSAGNDIAVFTDDGTVGDVSITDDLTVAGDFVFPGTAGAQGALRAVKQLTAIASSASTTPSNVSELAWSVPAGGADLQCEFQTRSDATTTGIQVGVDVNNAPASINGSCDTWTGAATYTRTAFNTDDGACSFTDTAVASPASVPYRLSVHIAAFGSPSTVTVRLRSEVGASTVRLDPGSWCTLTSS